MSWLKRTNGRAANSKGARRLFAAYFLLAILAPGIARATGFTGTVTMEDGVTVLSGYLVEVANPTDDSIVASAFTNGSGVYDLTALAPGTYHLNVSSTGYFPNLRSSYTVTGGQDITINFALQSTGMEAFRDEFAVSDWALSYNFVDSTRLSSNGNVLNFGITHSAAANYAGITKAAPADMSIYPYITVRNRFNLASGSVNSYGFIYDNPGTWSFRQNINANGTQTWPWQDHTYAITSNLATLVIILGDPPIAPVVADMFLDHAIVHSADRGYVGGQVIDQGGSLLGDVRVALLKNGVTIAETLTDAGGNYEMWATTASAPYAIKASTMGVSFYGARNLSIAGRVLTSANMTLFTPPPGCGEVLDVGQGGLAAHGTIQAAVNSLPASISTTTCIVIRDTQTYSEQVTVQGVTNNGHRLKIMADPTFVSSAPVVNPPVASTAAFRIINDSVTIQGINIVSTNTVPYGILASSSNISISGVAVFGGGGTINTAGVSISSWSAVSNSTISVGGAFGLLLGGEFSSISQSTVTNNSGPLPALSLSGASSNTLTGNYFYNQSGDGARFGSNSNSNSIGQSVIKTDGSGKSALYLNNSSSNTVTAVNMQAPSGYGLYLTAAAGYNHIDQSTVTTGGVGSSAVHLDNVSSNTIDGSYIINALGDSVRLLANANFNTISQSTITTIGGGSSALFMNGASSNTIAASVLSAPAGYAAYLFFNSNFNQISQSTMTSNSPAFSALYFDGVSSNTLTGNYVSNISSTAVFFTSSYYNSIAQSTVTSNTALSPALYMTLSSSNTITGSYIANQAGTVVRLDSFADSNTISQSTITSAASNLAALSMYKASSNTLTGNYISNVSSGAYLASDCNSNSITLSTITSSAFGASALYITDNASNTVTNSYISAPAGYGVYLFLMSGAVINQSTITSNSASLYAFYLKNSSSNTISGSYISNPSGQGLVFSNANNARNTITQSTVTSGGSGAALSVFGYLNSVLNSYIQGPNAVSLSNSTGTVIGGSVFVSTYSAPAGRGLLLASGNVGLTLSTSTVSGGSGGAAIELGPNNSGSIDLSSNTISGGSYGLNIDTQSAGATLSITSMTFQNLTAGATSINFLGGTMVATFTGVAFNSSNISVNVNADLLNVASRITMVSYSGAKAGPLFEKDVNGLVDWPCEALTSSLPGMWSAPGTWSRGFVPMACNPVTILAGHTVVLDAMDAVSSGTVINGVLQASRVVSSSWTLAGGDVVVNPGGALDFGTEADPLPAGTSAHLVLAYGQSAGQYGLIVNNGGNFTVRGATKTPYSYATGDITTAVTNFAVYGSTSVEGWQPGDTITIGPTSGSGLTSTSSRTILSISGGPSFTVNWSGGILPQVRSIADGPIIISNLTRNVVVRSSGTNTGGDTAYIRNLARNATSFALAYGEFAYLGTNTSSKYGITFDGVGTRGEISSSTVRNGYYGIYLNNSSDNTLAANNLYSNANHGIYLWLSDRNTLARNNAHACGSGIQTSVLADNNTVTGNNTYSNSGVGFYVQGNANNTFAGNNVYSNSSGILLLNTDSHIMTGNNFYANGTAISFTRADSNTFVGNNVYSNTTSAIDVDDSSGNNFVAGKLGYNAAGANKPNTTEITFTPGKTEDLVLMDTRLNPTGGVSLLGFNTTGTYLLSYNQDFATGTVRLWGNYQLAGSTLTLDHATQLYASTATTPKLMRGTGHSADILVTYDNYAVSQLITIERRSGQWHVDGSITGPDMRVFSGSQAGLLVPSASPQFDMDFFQGGTQNEGDRVDFVLIAASKDSNRQKKLLFGPSAAGFNNGRSKLEVAPTGGLVLRGKTDGTANTLVDWLGGGSTYYTFVDSGAFTAEFSSFTNMDPDGIQLSGSAGVTISSSTFDYLGFASGTNTYITARNLASSATFYSVAFGMSRSSAGYDSAYNVRVDGTDTGLGWSYVYSGGDLWGENFDSDTNGRINWSPFPPFPGCATGVSVKQDGSEDHLSIQTAVDALDHNLTADTCVIIRDTQTYAEQVTVQGFTTNGYRLKIMADPTFVSSAPAVNPPAASVAAFRIMNDSVTVQGVNVISTSSLLYGILASSANINISSLTVSGGTGISLVGISLSSWSLVFNSSITVGNAYGVMVDYGIFNTISHSTITCSSGINRALYLNGASSNTVSASYISNLTGKGAEFVGGSNYNIIEQSTMTAYTSSGSAFRIANSSFNTVTNSYIYNPLSAAVWIENGANFNTIGQSVITSTGAGQPAFVIETAFSNTLTESVVTSPNGVAVIMYNGASDNAITQSTMTSNHGAYAALFVATASSNTVSGSVVSNPAGEGAHLENGSNSNTITQSTITSNSATYALYLAASASNTVTGSYIYNPSGHGLYMVGSSSHNVVSQSTIASNGPGSMSVYFSGATSNTITGSYISNPSGYGAWLDSNANSNTISQSTITSNDNAYRALYLLGASSNTVTGSVISNPAGRAVYLDAGANANTVSSSSVTSADLTYAAFTVEGSILNSVTYSSVYNSAGTAILLVNASSNTISYSTMSTIAAGYVALYYNTSSSNTLTGSYLSSQNGIGVYLQNSNDNTISYSTMTSDESVGNALYMVNSDSTTVTGSYMVNLPGNCAFLDSGSDRNTISGSRMESDAAGYSAFLISSASSNTVTNSYMSNPDGKGLYLLNGAQYNTVSYSTITSANAVYSALMIKDSSSNTVTGSFIQGSTAAYVSGSTGTTFGWSVFVATDTAGYGLRLAHGSMNLALSSSTLSGGPQGAGIYLARDNSGTLEISSNTVIGGKYGLNIDTQSAGATLSITSMTFLNLTAGATAINFLGGQFISTFTKVAFNDASIGTNVNGSLLDPGSSITMSRYSGIKGGALYENDPLGYVDWGTLPAGCGAGANVSKAGAPAYTTIQEAIDNLNVSLDDDTCVVIRDTQTYSEQVTVQGFTTNGYRLKIMADPTFVSSAPTINPPLASTAAFQIMNDSVTLQGIMVVTTNTVPYGIMASSANVAISSVMVVGGTGITIAGIELSNWNAVSNSIVAVQNATALYLANSIGASVAYSTGTNNSGTFYALFLNNTSSSAFTNGIVRNPGGSAVSVTNSNFTLIGQSTVTCQNSCVTLDTGASSGTITQSYILSTSGNGLTFSNSASYNTVSQSTIASTAVGQIGVFFVSGPAYNTVTTSVITALDGYGVLFSNSSSSNTISYSDISNDSGGTAAIVFGGAPEYSNTVTRSFINNAGGGVGAQFEPGAKWNTLSYSTVTSVGLALYFNASSSNTVTNSYIRGAVCADISGSTGTVVNSSVLERSGTTNLRLRDGSRNLSLSSNTITGVAGVGVDLWAYNSGLVDLSSNTISGGAYGVNIDTQNTGAALSITSMTFASLSPGATAINFLGGQFVSTFTAVRFDDANIAVNISGSLLAPGSRIQILGYAGAKRGPAFENDPYGYVDWGYAPAAVTDLAVTVLSTGNINLNWTAPGEDGMTGVLNNSTFTIQFTSVAVDAQNPVFWSTSTPSVILSTTGVSPGTSQYYALPGLNANTSYYFRLWTKDEIENYSALSNGATAATLADQPPGPQVGTVFYTSATITWTALPAAPSSATCEGYLVQASTAAGFTGTVLSSSTPDSQVSSLVVGPLVEGNTYYFRVASLNWSGSPNYSGVTLSSMTLDNVPPAAVTLLAGVAVASDTVNLSWPSPGNNGAVGILTGAFTIQFTSVAVEAQNPAFWSTAAAQVGISTAGVQPAELQNYDIENLLSGVTYYFRLWTNDALANFSPLSNGATVIMPPNPPSAPQVLAVSSNTMSVSWTGNGIPGGSYLAEAGNDEAFTLNAVSTITVSTSHVFTGLFPNAVYFARVKSLGEGVIDSDFVSFAATATLSAPVTGAQILDVFATSATLSWTDGVNPEGTSYDISVSSDNFATLNYSTTTDQAAYTAAALAPNTTYYFRTAALNSGGVKSDDAVFPSTMTRAAVPDPHAVVFSSVTTDKIEVRWLQNGNPATVEYLLQASTASSFTGQLDIFLGWSPWAVSVPVTPLDSGVTFYFQVKARDSLQRETAWRYLGVQRTDLGADNAPPSVIDMQGGDDTWRGAASGSYRVRFYDGGTGLSKFEVRLSTSQGLAGTPLTAWTEVVTNINAQDYNTDWQLPLAAFQTIPEGVTAYASVRVYDAAVPTPNVTISTDVFYVIRDTTPPTITNNAVSPSGWQFADPGVFDVNFADARSGLAFIQYSASGSAGAADAALLGWTDIDTLVSSSAYTTDWGVAFAALTGGTTNYISARAIDAAGNTVTRADVFKILKAAGSPLVAMTSPSAAYISTAASLSGSAYGGSDGITVNYVEVWLRNLSSGQYYDGAAGTFTSASPLWLKASGAESWALNISTFGCVNLSSYTAVARTLDSVARYSLVYATVTFTLDQDAPSVHLSSPVALSTVSVFDVATGTAADTGSGPATAGISVKRVLDGKWWDFTNRVWGSAQVSSMTPVAGGSWTFLPDVYLRANVLSGYDYFVTAYAADAAAPANVSVFGAIGSTFTFADTVPPGAAVTVYASTDSEASLPGKLSVTWVFPGDDGNTGMLATGRFAIQRSTYTGFAFSTASAQVNESTSSILAGSTQTYILSGLANSTTYYLRVWSRDDAGLWSAASPEFMGVSGEGLPNEIAGHVRTALGQGITGVFVEAFTSLTTSERSTYTVNGTSGSFSLTGLSKPVYRIQVTWIENGIASSVAKDGILTGYTDADFTLAVTYTLGSISGTLPLSVSGRRASAFSPPGSGAVELWQNGRRIATVSPEADGSFRITNVLPGDYELRGPGMAPLQVRLRSGENLVVRPSSDIILGESVYAYPNPARARVTFRLQTEAASGRDEITVFDITGRLVKTITHEDPAWDRTNPYNIRWVTWDFAGSKVASGVYIYKVNMRSDVTGKTKVKTGKFAIVR